MVRARPHPAVQLWIIMNVHFLAPSKWFFSHQLKHAKKTEQILKPSRAQMLRTGPRDPPENSAYETGRYFISEVFYLYHLRLIIRVRIITWRNRGDVYFWEPYANRSSHRLCRFRFKEWVRGINVYYCRVCKVYRYQRALESWVGFGDLSMRSSGRHRQILIGGDCHFPPGHVARLGMVNDSRE